MADHHIGITHAGDGCSRRIALLQQGFSALVGVAPQRIPCIVRTGLERQRRAQQERPFPNRARSHHSHPRRPNSAASTKSAGNNQIPASRHFDSVTSVASPPRSGDCCAASSVVRSGSLDKGR